MADEPRRWAAIADGVMRSWADGDLVASAQLLGGAQRPEDRGILLVAEAVQLLHEDQGRTTVTRGSRIRELVGHAAADYGDDPRILLACAMVLLDLDDIKGAAGYVMGIEPKLNEVTSSADRAALAHVLGRLAAEAGHLDVAEQQLRYAVATDPETDEHRQALEVLLQ